MSKIIEKIVSQSTAPSDKNVGWWNGKELKFYTNGKWKTSGGSSNNKSLLDVLTLVDKPLSVFNIYPLNEEHPIEDFGISEDLLTSIYCEKKYCEYNYTDIYIDTICNNQTGEIYNRGGYFVHHGSNTYDLFIFMEDDEEVNYEYKLQFDFFNKTGTFVRIK